MRKFLILLLLVVLSPLHVNGAIRYDRYCDLSLRDFLDALQDTYDDCAEKQRDGFLKCNFCNTERGRHAEESSFLARTIGKRHFFRKAKLRGIGVKAFRTDDYGGMTVSA